MTTRRCVHAVLLGLLVGLATSCREPPEKARARGDEPAAALPAARRVPPELQTIGERPPQILRAAADNDWPQVHICVKELNEAWLAYKYPTVAALGYPRPPVVQLRGPLDGAMFRLRFADAQGQAQEIMQAASEVEAASLELFAYYLGGASGNSSPARAKDYSSSVRANDYSPLLEWRRLRMLEGRLLLHAVAGRLDRAQSTLTEVRTVWEHLRPALETPSQPDVPAQWDDGLAAQQEALNHGDPAALAVCARQALEALRAAAPLADEEKK